MYEQRSKRVRTKPNVGTHPDQIFDRLTGQFRSNFVLFLTSPHICAVPVHRKFNFSQLKFINYGNQWKNSTDRYEVLASARMTSMGGERRSFQPPLETKFVTI